MNNNNRKLRLAQAAVSLRSANPSGWNAFMKVLAERIEEITEQLVSSASDAVSLAKNQGHALEARALFKELDEAPSLVEKEQNRGKTPRQP